MSLRKKGASLAAAVSFWLGNPALNPAVLFFIVATIGWKWAALRLILGLGLVIAAVAVTIRLGSTVKSGVREADINRLEASAEESSCPRGSLALAWLRNVVRMGIRITPEYFIVTGLMGAARAFLFPTGALHVGTNPLLLAGLAVGGTLFPVPTAGEIPIVQTMLGAGIGPGTAGVLLLTLAPLSLPSLMVVARVFPLRLLAALAGLTVIAGLVGGVLAQALRF